MFKPAYVQKHGMQGFISTIPSPLVSVLCISQRTPRKLQISLSNPAVGLDLMACSCTSVLLYPQPVSSIQMSPILLIFRVWDRPRKCDFVNGIIWFVRKQTADCAMDLIIFSIQIILATILFFADWKPHHMHRYFPLPLRNEQMDPYTFMITKVLICQGLYWKQKAAIWLNLGPVPCFFLSQLLGDSSELSMCLVLWFFQKIIICSTNNYLIKLSPTACTSSKFYLKPRSWNRATGNHQMMLKLNDFCETEFFPDFSLSFSVPPGKCWVRHPWSILQVAKTRNLDLLYTSQVLSLWRAMLSLYGQEAATLLYMTQNGFILVLWLWKRSHL